MHRTLGKELLSQLTANLKKKQPQTYLTTVILENIKTVLCSLYNKFSK
jgi:hypothetical protein